jgi:hypothetical protein
MLNKREQQRADGSLYNFNEMYPGLKLNKPWFQCPVKKKGARGRTVPSPGNVPQYKAGQNRSKHYFQDYKRAQAHLKAGFTLTANAIVKKGAK